MLLKHEKDEFVYHGERENLRAVLRCGEPSTLATSALVCVRVQLCSSRSETRTEGGQTWKEKSPPLQSGDTFGARQPCVFRQRERVEGEEVLKEEDRD